MKQEKFLNIVGWVGAACVLAAYALGAFGFLSVQSWLYLVLNGFGAICLIYENAAQKDYPVIALNSVWLIVALIGLARVFF